jgi:L-2-hydroxyglutarate oxidase LhgO
MRGGAVFDSHGLMTALQGDLENAGGMVALGSAIRAIQLGAGPQGMHVVESVSDGVMMTMAARLVINAAALGAPQLARRMHGLQAQHIPQEHYAKGNYYALAGRAPFSHLIYPIPDASSLAGLGVHLTLDLGGQAKFGPDVEWLGDIEDPARIDYRVDPKRSEGFYAEVRKYWPDLPDGALQPSYSGVRPKISAPGEATADFRIDGAGVHGVPGLINLFGIESPGLTSALAIGEHVLTLLD